MSQLISEIVKTKTTKDMIQALCKIINTMYQGKSVIEIQQMLRVAKAAADVYNMEDKSDAILELQSLVANKVQ